MVQNSERGVVAQHVHKLQLGRQYVRSFRNVVFIPILEADEGLGRQVECLYLSAALDDGTVEITETQNVQSLSLQSSSDLPVFALAGTYLRGGGQDRVLPMSVMIPAHAEGQIPVRCVEYGRWNPSRGQNFTSVDGGSLVASRVCFGSDSITQENIWKTVADISLSTHTVSRTGSHGYSIEQMREGVGLYAEAIARLPLPNRTVGGLFFAGRGNSCLHCAVDIFASPNLYQLHFSKLCESVAMTALAGRPADGSWGYSVGSPLAPLWKIALHNLCNAQLVEERISLNSGLLEIKPLGKSGCRVSKLSYQGEMVHVMLRWDALCV